MKVKHIPAQVIEEKTEVTFEPGDVIHSGKAYPMVWVRIANGSWLYINVQSGETRISKNADADFAAEYGKGFNNLYLTENMS